MNRLENIPLIEAVIEEIPTELGSKMIKFFDSRSKENILLYVFPKGSKFYGKHDLQSYEIDFVFESVLDAIRKISKYSARRTLQLNIDFVIE